MQRGDALYRAGLVRPYTSDPMGWEYTRTLSVFLEAIESTWHEDEFPTIVVHAPTCPWMMKAAQYASTDGDLDSVKSDAAKKAIKLLRQSPFKFEAADLEETTASDFAGDVMADATTDMAINHYERTGENQYSVIQSIKTLRKKVSPNHPMLVDNLIIDRLRNNNTYYCGVGDLTKRAPKKDQTADMTRLDASHVYFTGNNGKLRNFGMYSANERYHVLITKEPMEYLEKLFEFQRKVNKELHQVLPETVFRIKESTGVGVNSLVSEGDFSGFGITETGDLYTNTLRMTDVSYVMNPARLKMRVMKMYDWAEEVLRRFIDLDDPNDTNELHLTEVTDFFYTVNEKGAVVMNPDRNVKEEKMVIKGIAYEGGVTSITALGKVTAPTFQEFKRWVKYNPRVWVNTRRVEEYLVRYSFIVKTDLGHLHYTCPYGGVKVLRKASAKAREKAS